MDAKPTYPRLRIKYNIEKINGIAEKLAGIVEEAIAESGQTGLQIGDVEMRNVSMI